MPAPTLVIVNPRSHAGATGRRWREIEGVLRARLGPLEVRLTRGPRDAEGLARDGVRDGAERVVLAGGDGTTNEVVTGLLSAGLVEPPRLGLLPLGTASDLGRALDVPRDVRAAIDRLATGGRRRIDAGRVFYRDRDGREADGYFLNIGSFGISSLTADYVNRTTKALGGEVSYFLAALGAIFRYRNAPVSVRVDGELVHEGPLVLGTAANGRFFGGGMQVAPRARLDDGLLDAVVVSALSKPALIRHLPSIYGGGHLDNVAVSYHRGKCIEADAEPGTVWMEVDGEARGRLPARFEVLPRAIELFGVAP